MEAHKGYTRITRQIIFSYGSLFLTILISPILIYLLTRNLTVEEFGSYSLLSVTVTVFFIVLGFGFPQYILTRFSGMDKTLKRKGLFSLIVFELLFLFFVVLMIFLTPLQDFILKMLRLTDYRLEFQLTFAVVFITTLSGTISAYLTAEKRLELTSILGFLEKCLWIFFLVIFFWMARTLTISSVIILWLIGISVTLLFSLFYIKEDLFGKRLKLFDLKIVKNALIFGIPMVPASLAGWLLQIGNRYVLNYYGGPTPVGLFTLAYSLTALILSLSIVITRVFYPYIAEKWNKKEDYSMLLNANLKYCLIIILPLIIGFFFLRDQIIILMSGPSYLQSSPILAMLLLFPIFAFLTNLFGGLLMLENRTKLMAAVYLTACVLNIVLNFILIPIMGLYGSAVVTVFSYVFVFLLFYFPCRKYLRLDYKFLKIPRILIASSLVGIFFLIANPQVVLTKIVVILCGIVLYASLLIIFKILVKEELMFIKLVFKRREKI